jgi:fumarate reductase subunit C
MSEKPIYTEFHPRWYRPRMSTYWWLKRPAYLIFILREVSSVFIAWFVFVILLHAWALKHWTPKEFQDFNDHFYKHPVVLAVNCVSLFFILFHSITWFHLAPKAMVLRFRGQRVPGKWIVASNYLAWGIISVAVVWVLYGVGK